MIAKILYILGRIILGSECLVVKHGIVRTVKVFGQPRQIGDASFELHLNNRFLGNSFAGVDKHNSIGCTHAIHSSCRGIFQNGDIFDFLDGNIGHAAFYPIHQD